MYRVALSNGLSVLFLHVFSFHPIEQWETGLQYYFPVSHLVVACLSLFGVRLPDTQFFRLGGHSFDRCGVTVRVPVLFHGIIQFLIRLSGIIHNEFDPVIEE